MLRCLFVIWSLYCFVVLLRLFLDFDLFLGWLWLFNLCHWSFYTFTNFLYRNILFSWYYRCFLCKNFFRYYVSWFLNMLRLFNLLNLLMFYWLNLFYLLDILNLYFLANLLHRNFFQWLCLSNRLSNICHFWNSTLGLLIIFLYWTLQRLSKINILRIFTFSYWLNFLCCTLQ